MNIDRGQTSFNEEEIAALQKRVLVYKETGGLSWSEMGKRTGIAFSTLQAFSSGTYAGRNANVAADVHKFFLSEAAESELAKDAPIAPQFQRTKTAKRIHATLSWAKRGNIVLIIGNPGVGKTAAIDQFAADTPNVWKITAAPSKSTMNAILLAIVTAFGVSREGGSGYQLSQLIRRNVSNRSGLLIFDEAQHLDERALEELRSIYDDTNVGIAFCGNRKISGKVEGDRTAGYAQRFSRISMRQIIDTPEDEDVALLLSAWGITHTKELTYLRAIAMRSGGGGLRTLNKLLELATLIARQDQDAEMCLTHMQDAWAQLSAGTGAGA